MSDGIPVAQKTLVGHGLNSLNEASAVLELRSQVLQDGCIFFGGLLFKKCFLGSESVISMGKKVLSVLGSIISRHGSSF